MTDKKKVVIKGEFFFPRSSTSYRADLILSSRGIRVVSEVETNTSNLLVNRFQDNRHIYFLSGHYFLADEAISRQVQNDFAYIFQEVPHTDVKSLKPEQKKENSRAPESIYKTEQSATTGFKKKFNTRSFLQLCGLILIFIGCLLGIRLVFPYVVSPIVSQIHPSFEKTIGESAYKAAKKAFFKPSTIDHLRREKLKKRAAEMAHVAGFKYKPEIYFHASNLGPNAFAFPAGPIVVTDDLVELLKDDKLILAIIGHEYGHVEERHSLKQLVRLAGLTLLATIVFGGEEGVMEELTGVAIGAWTLSNSRKFESEADLASVKFLKINNLDPNLVITVLKKLTQYACRKQKSKSHEKCLKAKSGWSQTHPSGAERIEQLKEAIETP